MEVDNDSDQDVSYDAATGSGDDPPNQTFTGTLTSGDSASVSVPSGNISLTFKLTVGSSTCTPSTVVTGDVNSKTIALEGNSGTSCSDYTISVT